jgi:hypothetical protein
MGSIASIIIALLPLMKEIWTDGVKWYMTPKDNMTPQEQIAALEAVKKLLPDMEVKI